MSDDPKLPDAPGTPSTPPPPPATPGAPDAPVTPSAVPNEPSGDLGSLAAEPTEVMPVTDPAAGGAVPPVDPPDAPGEPGEPEEEIPWYKKPGPVAILVIVVLAILGLLAWLIFGGGDDDDEATATSTFLAFETTDEAGTAIDVGFAVAVEGPADAAQSFVWLRPDGVPPGDIAGDSTGSDGRVEFEWEPDSSVTDPTTWESTVTVIAEIPAGWTPPGPNVDCVLTPFDGPTSSVTFNIELDSTDDTIDRIGTGSFPNQTFAVGDSVTCRLVAGAPAPTTVVETTVAESTVPETTEVTSTTVPETTVPETTAPTTTTPPSTTTTTIDIPPPLPTETLWDIITKEDELSEFEQLVLDAGYDDELSDPDLTFTIFAPTNAAIDAARAELEAGTVPVDEQFLNDLLLAHAADTAYTLADLLALDPPEVAVLFGGPQPIATASAPSLGMIGDANILFEAAPASNGNLFMIDAVLTPVP
jgi:uncharacterized surface protein with fasciclin (FAS1) repeats